MVGVYAREAFRKVTLIEQYLIAKDILKPGELDSLQEALYRAQAAQAEIERQKQVEEDKKVWETFQDGREIIHMDPTHAWNDEWKGIVIAKSAEPYKAITVRITTKYKGLKVGSVHTFEELWSKTLKITTVTV